MVKDEVLLKRLRNLSPLMSKLVDMAEKEQITIMTTASCADYMKSIGRNDLVPQNYMATRDCSDVGLGKVIIISPEYFSRILQEGNLGPLELGFAHEIGHNLILNLVPVCKAEETCCQYLEVTAYKLAVEIIRNLNGKKRIKLIYFGKSTSLKKILKAEKYPVRDTKDCDECAALLKLTDGCPKKEEIKNTLKEILSKA